MAETSYSLLKELPEINVSDVNLHLISLSYRSQLLNRKPRTAKTKRIGELAYSGRKLFRQKGTGFARQGERGNPHMRGGAVPMGPLPNLRNIKINKKVKRLAFHSAIKYHLDNNAIKIINDEEFESITKTKDAYSALVKSGFTGTGILVISPSAAVQRAVRNIAGVTTLTPRKLTVAHLVNSDFLIFTQKALEEFRNYLKTLSIRKEDEISDDKNIVSVPEKVKVTSTTKKARSAKAGEEDE